MCARPATHVPAPAPSADRLEIVGALEAFLKSVRIRRVYVAETSLAPPPLAYITPFSRLSIPLAGEHTMAIGRANKTRTIRPERGDAVFVPANAWNRPDWQTPVTVLTVLLGAKQIGLSLVKHEGGIDSPLETLKTSVHGGYSGPTQDIVRALTRTATERPNHEITNSPRSKLPRLLTESLLHACLHLLTSPAMHSPRKALRTYEALCLYVQGHYQEQLTRESIAQQFGLAPTHVSRLFRREGLIRFNDYLNLVRVNRAKFLLRSYRMPLKEIAAHCGYNDVAYFCQMFKRICGMTPTQYRDIERPRRTLTSESHLR